MSALSEAEVARLARLARLRLEPEDAARLAGELGAIARAFDGLAAFAAGLPDADARVSAALREDVAVPAPPEAPDAILAQAPAVEAGSRLVRVPRGRP